MFDDPEIDKLIILALIGICAVLFIAVIFLAIKKNTYYVDDNGEEIPPKNAKIKRVGTTGKNKPVILDDDDDDDDEDYEDEEEIKLKPVVRKKTAAVEETVVQPIQEVQAVSERPEEKKPVQKTAPANVDPLGIAVTVKVAGKTADYTVDTLPCLIGREASSCDLTISEPAVSRRHARFVKDGKSMYIEDVSEHNGTYLNGTKLPPLGRAKLQEGDRINLGRAEIRIQKFIY